MTSLVPTLLVDHEVGAPATGREAIITITPLPGAEVQMPTAGSPPGSSTDPGPGGPSPYGPGPSSSADDSWLWGPPPLHLGASLEDPALAVPLQEELMVGATEQVAAFKCSLTAYTGNVCGRTKPERSKPKPSSKAGTGRPGPSKAPPPKPSHWHLPTYVRWFCGAWGGELDEARTLQCLSGFSRRQPERLSGGHALDLWSLWGGKFSPEECMQLPLL